MQISDIPHKCHIQSDASGLDVEQSSDCIDQLLPTAYMHTLDKPATTECNYIPTIVNIARVTRRDTGLIKANEL